MTPGTSRPPGDVVRPHSTSPIDVDSVRYEREGFLAAPDGTRLFYGVNGVRHTGGPAPIMLLDGMGCDGFAWHYLRPHLAETRRVVHPHYRGHGRSGVPVDRERLAVAGLAQDTLTVMDAEELPPAVLVGHSMGTQVALEVFRAAPERVKAIISLCGTYGRVTHTFHGTDVLAQILPGIRRIVEANDTLTRALWGRVPPKTAYRIARLSGEVDPHTIRESDFRRYWEHIALMNPEVFLRVLQGAGDHSAEDLLLEVSVPTLVLAAERDTYTPPATARALADAIPAAEFFILRGGSHAAPVEQPMTVQLRVDKFLAERVDD